MTITLPPGDSPESASGTLRFLGMFFPRLEPVFREWDEEDPNAPSILPEVRFPTDLDTWPRYRSLRPFLIESGDGLILDPTRFRRLVLPKRPKRPGTVTVLGSALSSRAAAAREWARKKYPDHVIETRYHAILTEEENEQRLVLQMDENGIWHLVPEPGQQKVFFPFGDPEERETLFQLALREIRPDLLARYRECSDPLIARGKAPSTCLSLIPPDVLEAVQSPALQKEARRSLFRDLQWQADLPTMDFGILIENRTFLREML